MSARRYVMKSERVEGQLRPVVRVTCRSCGVSHAFPMTADKILPHDIIAKKLKQQGWEIGSNENRDLCPGCAIKQKKRDDSKPALTVVANSDDVPVIGVAVPPPREMSREDRRIVFEKLNEVYLDERRGYDSDWSDHRVATDLGVPRKWVETVRKELFGDNGGNEELSAFLDQARQMLDEAQKLAKAADETWAKVDARLETLERTAAELRKRMGP